MIGSIGSYLFFRIPTVTRFPKRSPQARHFLFQELDGATVADDLSREVTLFQHVPNPLYVCLFARIRRVVVLVRVLERLQ
ncbi:hypothetical protein AQ943_01210 [Burkholderia pseudomallei]|nr:hypothetical protein EGY15_05320 [Burkholderia pseudomallei]OMT58005.1 hypothetical protein AQ761_05410 [Burkholderia pseudomallei]ONE03093.1 hypothetical protein AQ943_01210 [Burkholderia pseudomallei]ONE58825.1 hypothetical protein AQ951_16560 [Burkholderia pseudomallei]